MTDEEIQMLVVIGRHWMEYIDECRNQGEEASVEDFGIYLANVGE